MMEGLSSPEALLKAALPINVKMQTYAYVKFPWNGEIWDAAIIISELAEKDAGESGEGNLISALSLIPMGAVEISAVNMIWKARESVGILIRKISPTEQNPPA